MDSRRLGELNEAAALGHLLDRGPLTRGDLCALTGLAKPTASDVVRRLRAAGLVRVVGRTSGGRGPNAELYAVDPDAAFAAAVSLRARDSTLVAAVCDLAGEVRARTETAVDFGRADPAAAVHDAVRVVARRRPGWCGWWACRRRGGGRAATAPRAPGLRGAGAANRLPGLPCLIQSDTVPPAVTGKLA